MSQSHTDQGNEGPQKHSRWHRKQGQKDRRQRMANLGTGGSNLESHNRKQVPFNHTQTGSKYHTQKK